MAGKGFAPADSKCAPVVDGRKLREVAGRFATGVAIVTSRLGDEVQGMTVNSLCSVSLQPPLILYCATPGSKTAGLIQRSRVFAVSILDESQQALSTRFASIDPEFTRFDDLETFQAGSGSPILRRSVAWMDCTLEAVYPGGDHLIMVARVEAAAIGTDAPPLIFQASRYRMLAE